MQYPPASLEKAVQSIFLDGATSQAAWHAKLALLAYYLLDAGLVADAGELTQVILLISTSLTATSTDRARVGITFAYQKRTHL